MKTSRRTFLKTLGAVGLSTIVPRRVLGGNGYIAHSDTSCRLPALRTPAHSRRVAPARAEITVAVNGQQMLKGNIRTVCQGHNVAPDGSDYNPYTVDHHNHPGLFNKEGYISFCGHGEGVRFRNIRVLDLGKKPRARASRRARSEK